MNNSECDSSDKNDMQKKVNVLVMLQETMQKKKKLKQHHIQNQSKFLPSYLINGLECTVQNILKSLNTLFQLHMQVKYYQNMFLKKTKVIITETLHLVTNVFEDDNFSR